MNKLDRELQLKFLKELEEMYPEAYIDYKEPSRETVVNLAYLADHDLINCETRTDDNGRISIISAKITAAGLDFLADDGGLTAILGVVTVKLHADTIKDLMIAKIQSSEATPTVKQNLIKKLKELPADTAKELFMTIVKKGIDSIPDVAKWLPTFFHSLQ